MYKSVRDEYNYTGCTAMWRVVAINLIASQFKYYTRRLIIRASHVR